MNHNDALQHPIRTEEKDKLVRFMQLVRFAKESDISTLQREEVKKQFHFMREIRLVSYLWKA